MFSFIPDLQLIETQTGIDTLPQAFQMYHSTVNDVFYRSVGEARASETHCIFHYTVKGRGEVVYHGKAHFTGAGDIGMLIVGKPRVFPILLPDSTFPDMKYGAPKSCLATSTLPSRRYDLIRVEEIVWFSKLISSAIYALSPASSISWDSIFRLPLAPFPKRKLYPATTAFAPK